MRSLFLAAFMVVVASGTVRSSAEPAASEPVVGTPQAGPADGAVKRRSARDQLREELDSLLRAGITKPYGTAWGKVPEAVVKGGPAPVVTFEPGGTAAAGLILELSGLLLDDARYRDAALSAARAVVFSMDGTGRVPGSATMLPGSLGARETRGQYPKRGSTTAAAGFLLLLDKDLKGDDSRVASGAVRASNWVVKQQTRNGAFLSSVDMPKETYPKRVVRLDVPDTRDGVITFLLIQKCAEERDTTLPATLARLGLERGIEPLIKLRMTELGQPSRYLWAAAYDVDGTMLDRNPAFPRTGNLLATRYAMQTLLAYHLATADVPSFDVVRVSADAVEKQKDKTGRWSLVDDPLNRFPVPQGAGELDASGSETWPRADFGLPPTLQTIADLRVLGRETFLKLTSKTLPLDVSLAAILTGLTDAFPAADLPLSAKQVEAYTKDHPELFAVLNGPEPIDLTQRVKRLWALYLLAGWEKRFEK